MPQNLPKYEHQPLDWKSKEIRLFRLLPDLDQDGRLQGEIKHVSLDDKPSYNALSYVWGPEQPVYKVVIGDQIITIRKYLQEFLNKLRCFRQDGKRVYWMLDEDLTWFWVDQITINQADDTERGHQVAAMADIYGGARGVIAWLGGDSRFDPAHQCYLPCERFKDCWQFETEEKWIRYVRAVNHTYWTRIWIVQELTLAREFMLLDDIGAPCADYVRWVLAQYNVDDSRHTEVLSIRRGCHILTLLHDLNRRRLQGDLRDVLGDFRISGDCHLACDRIYALLGMVRPVDRVVVDYTLPTDKLLDKVIDQIVKSRNSSGFPSEPSTLVGPMQTLIQHLGVPPRWQARASSYADDNSAILLQSKRERMDCEEEWDRRRDFKSRHGSPERDALTFAWRRERYPSLFALLDIMSYCQLVFEKLGYLGLRYERWSMEQSAKIFFIAEREVQNLNCSLKDWVSKLNKATIDKPLKVQTSEYYEELVPSADRQEYPPDLSEEETY